MIGRCQQTESGALRDDEWEHSPTKVPADALEQIYLDIFELAKPYYEKGRPYDIKSIEWMAEQADRIADIEGLDKKLLMPIIILHDVGYSRVEEGNPNVKDRGSKTLHMKEGANISEMILEQVGYDEDYAKMIVHYVSVHDNWILGDDAPFKQCREMAVFNDLDFMYPLADREILRHRAKSMGQSIKENIAGFEADEKHERRPLCCEPTRKLYGELFKKAQSF